MRTTLAVLSLVAALGTPLSAQPGSDPAPQPGQSMTMTDLFEQIRRVEPIRRAGLRAGLLRQAQQVVPVVVVVSDARSYLAALSAWEGARRFPILWDDGSVRSREDVARFVRAFGPESVVRFRAEDGAADWPRDREGRQMAALKALARSAAEDAPDFGSFLMVLRNGGVVSPGIVITDVDDTAWPAALALAAGRYQPIGFIKRPATLNPPLTVDQAEMLEAVSERMATESGLAWREIGDDIDAITLCLNTGTRIRTGEEARDVIATTDRVGRLGPRGSGSRWAWTGQIIGSSPQALYRAMCALFLTVEDAFVFDGYDATEPWVTYSGTQAGDLLRSAGITPQIHSEPRNTVGHWLALSARPLNAGLILINSHGNASVLNFPGGQVRGADVPLLGKPAMAHVVHSFSLQNPPNRATVGGALLDRGVYALLGSTDEPYLQAFMPTPMVVRRMGAGMNFAAAVRIDDAPLWKLTVLGDPLITLGPAGTRLEETELGLPGTVEPLDALLKTALAERDLPRALELLTALGRDADAARLASAAMGDTTVRPTPEFYAAAIPALFRQSEHERVLTAYANLTDSLRGDPVLADCFWFSARFLLGSSPDRQRVESMMKLFQRPSSRISDAEEIAMHLRRRSPQEAMSVLESLRPVLTQAWEVEALEKAIQRVRTYD